MTPEEAKELEDYFKKKEAKEIEEYFASKRQITPLEKAGMGLTAPLKYVGGKILPELKSFISPFGEAKRLEKVFSTPEGQAQYIKEGTSLPLEIASLPGTMAISSYMAGTGLDKKVGEKVNEIMNKYKLSPETMELLGLSTALVGGRMLPIRKQQVPGVGQKLKSGKETTPGAVGEELIESGKKEVTRVKEEVYKPIKEQINAIKTNKNIGKETADEIKNYVNTSFKKANMTPQMRKSVLKIADEISKIKDMEVLLNKKKLVKGQLKTEYPNNPDFVTIQKQQIDRIINQKIYENIDNPILRANWRKANQAYGDMANAFEKLEKIYEGNSEKVFERVFSGGTNQIKSLKKLSGDEKVTKAGFNYLAEKIINIDGEFSAKSFKTALKTIGEDRGKLIFGENWGKLKDLSRALYLAEAPHKIVGNLPIINKLGITELLQTIEKISQKTMIDKPMVSKRETVAPYIAGEMVEHLERGSDNE